MAEIIEAGQSDAVFRFRAPLGSSSTRVVFLYPNGFGTMAASLFTVSGCRRQDLFQSAVGAWPAISSSFTFFGRICLNEDQIDTSRSSRLRPFGVRFGARPLFKLNPFLIALVR